MLGLWFHALYTLTVIIYVKQTNMVESDSQHFFALLLCVGIVYSALYDFGQLLKAGYVEYFGDPWNYSDILYTYGSFANLMMQFYYGPFHIGSRVMMILVVLMILIKTLSLLRIFPTLTPIVIMI